MALIREGKRVGGCSLRGRNQAARWSSCGVLEAIEDSEGAGAGQDQQKVMVVVIRGADWPRLTDAFLRNVCWRTLSIGV